MVRLLWKQHSQEEYWGFFLIDVRNYFNEEKRIAMLWMVHHKCRSVARFAFNFYHHWVTLVIMAVNGTGQFLYSKEGGDPGRSNFNGEMWAGDTPPHPGITYGPPQCHIALVCR